MNVHHLELFYYVARHGGISAAVRHIPYGIQQPAVSGQMRALEEYIKAKLFDRSPFRLTRAGERLYAHVRPFMENLPSLTAQIREESDPELRVGGAEVILRDHLSVVMQRLRAHYRRLRLRLRAGFQAEVESLLRDGQIDLGITPVGPRPPARLRQLRLVRIPLVLLVHRTSPWKSAAGLLARRKISDPLVGQPASTAIMSGFQRDLRRRGIVWPQTIEATSLELVTRYVANGEGHGVNIAEPAVIRHRDVRVLPLEGFTPMTLGVLWRGEPSALLRNVIAEIQSYSRETFPDWAVDDPLPAAVAG
jgi:DNA-binding transcriptional LysR family regulator